MDSQIIEDLKRDGIVVLPSVMAPHKIAAFNRYLSGKPLWNGHVKNFGKNQPGIPYENPSTSWAMEDVVLAPHFFETALDVMPLAEEFLGQPARLYSMNAFTTYPGEGQKMGIQDFHRDKDDRRFIALFMYCSIVSRPEDGAHQFVRGSHRDENNRKRPIDIDEVMTVTGPPGTAFLAITRGMHRGIRPQAVPRTMAWVRWGVSKRPVSYGWDRLEPVSREQLGDRYPTDPDLQTRIELVVN